jgi:hypothetical protein
VAQSLKTWTMEWTPSAMIALPLLGARVGHDPESGRARQRQDDPVRLDLGVRGGDDGGAPGPGDRSHRLPETDVQTVGHGLGEPAQTPVDGERRARAHAERGHGRRKRSAAAPQ